MKISKTSIISSLQLISRKSSLNIKEMLRRKDLSMGTKSIATTKDVKYKEVTWCAGRGSRKALPSELLLTEKLKAYQEIKVGVE